MEQVLTLHCRRILERNGEVRRDIVGGGGGDLDGELGEGKEGRLGIDRRQRGRQPSYTLISTADMRAMVHEGQQVTGRVKISVALPGRIMLVHIYFSFSFLRNEMVVCIHFSLCGLPF